MSTTIRAEGWKDLPPGVWQKEKETRIIEFEVDWTFDPPISHISYYPERRMLTYASAKGECRITFDGDITAKGGTQCYIRNGRTQRKVAMIHLDFVQPSLPITVDASEPDKEMNAEAGETRETKERSGDVSKLGRSLDGMTKEERESFIEHRRQQWDSGSFLTSSAGTKVPSSTAAGERSEGAEGLETQTPKRLVKPAASKSSWRWGK